MMGYSEVLKGTQGAVWVLP